MKSDFEKWDWKKEDKEFYDKASKMPEFQDEKYREMMKRQRYNFAFKSLYLCILDTIKKESNTELI